MQLIFELIMDDEISKLISYIKFLAIFYANQIY